MRPETMEYGRNVLSDRDKMVPKLYSRSLRSPASETTTLTTLYDHVVRLSLVNQLINFCPPARPLTYIANKKVHLVLRLLTYYVHPASMRARVCLYVHVMTDANTWFARSDSGRVRTDPSPTREIIRMRTGTVSWLFDATLEAIALCLSSSGSEFSRAYFSCV